MIALIKAILLAALIVICFCSLIIVPALAEMWFGDIGIVAVLFAYVMVILVTLILPDMK